MVDTNGIETSEPNPIIIIASGNYLEYVLILNMHAYMDIKYSSNGSITYTSPSTYDRVLNITENGQYYPEGLTTVKEINVNVPSANLVQKTITTNGTYNAI